MKTLSADLLSSKVIAQRKAKKLTQSELSKETAINRSLISQLENKEFTPSADQLMALASVLDFNINDVFADSAKTKEIVDAITDSVMHFSRSLFFQYGKRKYVTVFVCDTTVARCDVTSRNDVLLTVPMDNFCYGLILSAASLSEGHCLLSPSPDSMWRSIRREELPWWPSSLGRLP